MEITDKFETIIPIIRLQLTKSKEIRFSANSILKGLWDDPYTLHSLIQFIINPVQYQFSSLLIPPSRLYLKQ